MVVRGVGRLHEDRATAAGGRDHSKAQDLLIEGRRPTGIRDPQDDVTQTLYRHVPWILLRWSYLSAPTLTRRRLRANWESRHVHRTLMVSVSGENPRREPAQQAGGPWRFYEAHAQSRRGCALVDFA